MLSGLVGQAGRAKESPGSLGCWSGGGGEKPFPGLPVTGLARRSQSSSSFQKLQCFGTKTLTQKL